MVSKYSSHLWKTIQVSPRYFSIRYLCTLIDDIVFNPEGRIATGLNTKYNKEIMLAITKSVQTYT